jgi:hypothetical protein
MAAYCQKPEISKESEKPGNSGKNLYSLKNSCTQKISILFSDLIGFDVIGFQAADRGRRGVLLVEHVVPVDAGSDDPRTG